MWTAAVHLICELNSGCNLWTAVHLFLWTEYGHSMKNAWSFYFQWRELLFASTWSLKTYHPVSVSISVEYHWTENLWTECWGEGLHTEKCKGPLKLKLTISNAPSQTKTGHKTENQCSPAAPAPAREARVRDPAWRRRLGFTSEGKRGKRSWALATGHDEDRKDWRHSTLGPVNHGWKG